MDALLNRQIEDEINFDSFIRFPVFVLRFVLLEFKTLDENLSQWRKFIEWLKKAVLGICVFVHTTCIVCGIGNAVNSSDLVTIVGSILDALAAIVNQTKFWTILLHKKEIMVIFQDLRVIFDRHRNRNKEYGVKNYFDKYRFPIKIFATGT